MKTEYKKMTLQTEVESIVKEHQEGYDKPSDFFNDLRQGGCVSGLIGELIYYSDTLAFYNRHKEAINELLTDSLEGSGLNNLSELFGDKWDKTDPLIMENNNLNLLAWFAFEETAFAMERNWK